MRNHSKEMEAVNTQVKAIFWSSLNALSETMHNVKLVDVLPVSTEQRGIHRTADVSLSLAPKAGYERVYIMPSTT